MSMSESQNAVQRRCTMAEEIELSSSIRRLAKYLPPPLVDLDYVSSMRRQGRSDSAGPRAGRCRTRGTGRMRKPLLRSLHGYENANKSKGCFCHY